MGDTIVSVNDEPIPDWARLVAHLEKNPGREIRLGVRRGEESLTLALTPEDQDGVGKAGIINTPNLVRQDLGQAMATGITQAAQLTADQAGLLWGKITGQNNAQLAGPVNIVRMLAAQARRGLSNLLEMLALLSIGLFILNLAPIPALDGGRLIFLMVETVRGKPVNERIEGVAHAVGFLLLAGLMVVYTVRELLP